MSAIKTTKNTLYSVQLKCGTKTTFKTVNTGKVSIIAAR